MPVIDVDEKIMFLDYKPVISSLAISDNLISVVISMKKDQVFTMPKEDEYEAFFYVYKGKGKTKIFNEEVEFKEGDFIHLEAGEKWIKATDDLVLIMIRNVIE